MLHTKEVEVLSITQATDITTGDLVYSVGFGYRGTPMEGLQLNPKTKQISSMVLVVFFPLGKECPYKAGSKWTLNIEDDGKISLTEKKWGTQ